MGLRTGAGKQAEIRTSRRHSLDLHNALAKLISTPANHAKRLQQVSERVMHLVEVHNVPVTAPLQRMIQQAKSENKLTADVTERLFNGSELVM